MSGTVKPRKQAVLVSPVLRNGFVSVGPVDVSIGRSRSCHVVLPSDEVSRFHAKVSEVADCSHAITDMRSRNGTRVNGTRVHEMRRLQEGDEIAVGSFTLRYLVAEGTREELAARFDVQLETSIWLLGAPREPLLSGTIASDMLIETCQLVELNRHTGVIRVECDGVPGALRFRDGTIVGARFGADHGEGAARRILAQTRGRYHFDESDEGAPPDGLALRASILALDIVRLRDERASSRAETRRQPLVTFPAA